MSRRCVDQAAKFTHEILLAELVASEGYYPGAGFSCTRVEIPRNLDEGKPANLLTFFLGDEVLDQ